jgi:hypothetical protein
MQNCTLSEAIDYVRSKRCVINPAPNLVEFLHQLQKKYFGPNVPPPRTNVLFDIQPADDSVSLAKLESLVRNTKIEGLEWAAGLSFVGSTPRLV